MGIKVVVCHDRVKTFSAINLQMATQVGHYPAQYHDNMGMSNINTDPGVYEPECDWNEPVGPTGYPDTQEFLQQYATDQAPVDQQLPQENGAEQLKLAGDYKGLGGPKTVPLYTPDAFEAPSRPVERTILDEIFLEPTSKQLDAFYRVLTKEKLAQDKNRLKWAIFSHYILLFILLAKLTPEVLDRLDVFVLELEELFVPKPLLWEWLWLLSTPVTILGLNACKNSSLKSCKQFLIGTLTCSLLPIIIGMVSHAQDCYEFLAEGPSDDVQMWQGYPYAMLCYLFFLFALQVHFFQLYFANSLMQAWTCIQAKKAQ